MFVDIDTQILAVDFPGLLPKSAYTRTKITQEKHGRRNEGCYTGGSCPKRTGVKGGCPRGEIVAVALGFAGNGVHVAGDEAYQERPTDDGIDAKADQAVDGL